MLKKNMIIRVNVLLYVFLLMTIATVAQPKYSLSDCKALALKNNAKIKNAELEINASKETELAAYTKYFPQVSGSINGMYAFKNLIEMEQKGGNLPVYDGNPENLKNPTMFAYMPDTKISLLDKLAMGSVSIMQPIYAGGRISTGNKLAEIGTSINKEKLIMEQYKVCEKTEELYWNISSMQEKMKTIDYYIKFLGNLQKDVNVSFSAGLITKNDVLKVSIKLNELLINKLKLGNGIDLAKEAICQHIGVKYIKDMILTDLVTETSEPLTYYSDPNISLPNRAETRMLQNAVKAENLQTALKLGEYMPEVAVGSMFIYTNVLDKSTFNCVLLGTVNIPISGWWEASHSIQERKIREEITRNTEKETSEMLILQMSQNWNQLNETYKQIILGHEILGESQENFKVFQSNYKSGITTISDFLEAQASVQKAEDQLVEFTNNYRLAVTKYLQAIGKY